METEDIYAGLGALSSAISAALSYIWSIPFLQFLFTFILGSLITYLIQSKLQDRAGKRKITKEKIEKIYGPLYVELQEIKRNLIDNLEFTMSLVPMMEGEKKEPATWEKTKTYPEFFSIPLKLKDEVEDVIHKAEKLNNSLSEIKRIVDYIIIEVGTSVFKPYYKNIGSRISKNSVQGYLYIAIKSKTGAIYCSRLLHDYVILDKNPIEDMKQKFPDFSPERCQVHLMVEDSHQVGKDHHIDVPLTEMKEDLDRFLEIAKQEVTQEKEVSRFLEEKGELSEGIQKILPILKKHIEKHYPIETI